MPGEQLLQLHYVVEGDVYEGTFDDSKRSVVFVVLWRAKQGGEVSRGADNCLRSIHDQRVIPDYSKQAVYALQPDYQLRPLDLSDAERAAVFDSLMNRGAVWTNTFWSDKIWSKLSIVEQPTR